MKHPDEHTLELYVLNAESVATQRAEIEDHLRSCAGCKFLVGEISSFYTELDQELQKTDEHTAVLGERALMKRNHNLTLWEERLALGPWSGWGSPVKKVKYCIRRYPIATAGTTFAFAALAGIGLLMGYREITRDVNPAYVALNGSSGFFEVYNRRNELLWERLVNGLKDIVEDEGITGTRRYAVADLNADGKSEVLTTLALDGLPEVPLRNLHIFDGEGNYSDVVFERNVSYRGKRYEIPVRLDGGSLLLLDSTDNGTFELFLTVKNDRSPNAVLRINNRGEVIGEYWHYGQITSFYFYDIGGDGRDELIVCGFNDVNDEKEPSIPVIIVLDPRKISGRMESGLTRGFGHGATDAEKYCIRLPLTEYNMYAHIGAGVRRMWVRGDRFIFLSGFSDQAGLRNDLEFVFSKSLEPLRVISSTQSKELFNREYAQKHIMTRLDDAYLDYLKSQIRFWDGKEWRGEGEEKHV